MNANDSKRKKAKKPKKRTSANIHQASGSRPTGDSNINDVTESFCPLLAKDSEWVDILRTPRAMCSECTEEVQMELEYGPEMKPLAIMFPGLLEKDPQTLQDMLTKAMSTTDVTKHLVDLGQKANFTYMKKADRLIPPDKEWLVSVSEVTTDSNSSMGPGVSGSSNNEYREDAESKKLKKSN